MTTSFLQADLTALPATEPLFLVFAAERDLTSTPNLVYSKPNRSFVFLHGGGRDWLF